MRLRELHVAGEPPLTLALHPRITVVTGVPASTRARLLAALQALTRAGGSVEQEGAGGVTLTLERDGETLSLPPTTPADLGVAGGVELVVGAGDLAGAGGAAPTGVDAAKDRVARAQEAREATLALVREASAAARQAADDLANVGAEEDEAGPPSAEVEALEAKLAERERQLADATEWLAEVVSERRRLGEDVTVDATAPGAEAARERVEHARQALVDAEAATARARDALAVAEQRREMALDPEEVRRHAEEEVRAIEERLAAARADLVTEADVDPTPVIEALAALDAARDRPRPRSPEAAAVADGLARVRAQRAATGAGSDQVLEAAREEVAAARQAVAEAAAATKPLHLDPGVVTELERLHDAVEQAESKAAGRFASPLAKRRLQGAEEAERALLDQVGLRSYADYLIRSSPMSVDADAQRRLVEASSRLALAEQRLSHLESAGGSGERGLDDEEARLRSMAVELLGGDPGDDLEQALRELPGGTPDVGAELDDVLAALHQVGIAPDSDDVEGAARAWVADIGRPDRAAADAAEAAVVRLEDELDAARRRLEPTAGRADGTAGADDVEVAEESLRAAVAAEDAARHALEEAEAAAARAAAESAEAAAARERAGEERQGELDDLLRTEQEASAAVTSAEAELATARAELERLRQRPLIPAVHNELTAALRALDATTAREAAARAELDVVSAELRQARDALDAAVAAAGSAASGDVADGAGAPDGHGDAAAAELTTRLAAARSAGLPLVVDDALAGMDDEARSQALRALAGGGDDVQVVIFTDDAAVAVWADGLGAEAAAVARIDTAA